MSTPKGCCASWGPLEVVPSYMAIIDAAVVELASTAVSTVDTPKALSWPVIFLLMSMTAFGQAFMYAFATSCTMFWKALEPKIWSEPVVHRGAVLAVVAAVPDGPLPAGDPARE